MSLNRSGVHTACTDTIRMIARIRMMGLFHTILNTSLKSSSTVLGAGDEEKSLYYNSRNSHTKSFHNCGGAVLQRNTDSQKYTSEDSKAYIVLKEDSTFEFNYSLLSSTIPTGKYKIIGRQVHCYDNSEYELKYVFDVKGIRYRSMRCYHLNYPLFQKSKMVHSLNSCTNIEIRHK